MHLYCALSCYITKALRYGPCVTRGSHSFTCHPHTNHTCIYSLAARRHHPLAGTNCAYSRRDGQAELTCMAGCASLEVVWTHVVCCSCYSVAAVPFQLILHSFNTLLCNSHFIRSGQLHTVIMYVV